MKYTFNKAKGVFIYPFLFLMAFASCTKEAELGLEVLPSDSQVGAFEVDTFSITARTIAVDSIRTDERVLLLSGMYYDEEFGQVSSKLFTQLRPEQENLDFSGKEVILDSCFFTLKFYDANPFYANRRYVDQGIDLLHLYVHEITEDLKLDSNYLNSSSVSYNPDPIGFHIGVNPTQPTKDSVNGDFTLTFPIDTSWAGPLLRSNEIQSTDAFVARMKGIAVVVDSLSVPAQGGALYSFDPLSNFTRLHFHYRTRDEGDTGAYVNEVFNLIIDANTPRFNQHRIDRSGTIVEQSLDNTAFGNEQLFLQGLGGSNIELECTSFLEFFKENPAIINLAEVILPYTPDATNDYAVPEALYFKAKDENGVERFIVDQFESSGSHIDGRVDVEKDRYRFVVTRFMQNVILDYQNGINNNFGFVITPTNEASQPQRIITNGTNPSAGERIKFRFVYTPL